MKIIEGGGPKAGEALLTWVRFLRGEDGRAAAQTYLDHAHSVPWASSVEGTSGRLLALLSVGTLLSQEECQAACSGLRRAMENGAVALPKPRDRAEVQAGELHVALDPWWGAVQAMAQERLARADLDWDGVFAVEARRAQALAAWHTGGDDGVWALTSLKSGLWLATRRDGPELRLGLHTGEALGQAVDSLSLGDGDLRAVAFQPGVGWQTLASLGALEGTDQTLLIQHHDPDGASRSERRRLAFLRGRTGRIGPFGFGG